MKIKHLGILSATAVVLLSLSGAAQAGDHDGHPSRVSQRRHRPDFERLRDFAGALRVFAMTSGDMGLVLTDRIHASPAPALV